MAPGPAGWLRESGSRLPQSKGLFDLPATPIVALAPPDMPLSGWTIGMWSSSAADRVLVDVGGVEVCQTAGPVIARGI